MNGESAEGRVQNFAEDHPLKTHQHLDTSTGLIILSLQSVRLQAIPQCPSVDLRWIHVLMDLRYPHVCTCDRVTI